MHATRNDISAGSREALIALLNARLADALDVRLATKHAHWNVRGPHFSALHPHFDSIASELDDHIDDIAERAVQLGGTAYGTVQSLNRTTRVAAYPESLVDDLGHVAALADRIAFLGKNSRAAIDEATRLGDADTADLFTGISRALDKTLWMLEAHLR